MNGNEVVSTSETPIVGKPRANRLVTNVKSAETGELISVLIEERFDEKILSRQLDVYLPRRQTTRECFEPDGTLINSETERREDNGVISRIVIRGIGKSATARIVCGESEARATERSVIIETPRASYSFQPFEGKWSSYYKDVGMKLDLKANFLKNPDQTILGPDGIKLIFKKSRLVDVHFTEETTKRIVELENF